MFINIFKRLLLWNFSQHPANGKLKICSNGRGLMAQMVTMPIYGKNLKKSSPEPLGWLPWTLVCSIRWLSTTKFVQMVTLGWPWQGQIWSLGILNEEKVKQCYSKQSYSVIGKKVFHTPLWIPKAKFKHLIWNLWANFNQISDAASL